MLKQEAAASAPVAMPVEYSLDDFCFQVYVEVSLIQFDEVLEPKLFTGVKYAFELGEVMTFPIKFKDLAPLSRIAIEIYNIDRED